jgi:hypothetical protein
MSTILLLFNSLIGCHAHEIATSFQQEARQEEKSLAMTTLYTIVLQADNFKL